MTRRNGLIVLVLLVAVFFFFRSKNETQSRVSQDVMSPVNAQQGGLARPEPSPTDRPREVASVQATPDSPAVEEGDKTLPQFSRSEWRLIAELERNKADGVSDGFLNAVRSGKRGADLLEWIRLQAAGNFRAQAILIRWSRANGYLPQVKQMDGEQAKRPVREMFGNIIPVGEK